MRSSRWRGELDAATTDKDVLNVVRDYVALLTRDEIAALPRGCRPMPIDNVAHINEWAVRLITQCLEHHSESEGIGLLRDVSDFFAAASARLTALHPSDHRL